MSYILDALNKSEQERRNRQAPGIETRHRPVAAPVRSARGWIAGLSLLAAVNAGFFGYWYLIHVPTSKPQAVSPPAVATAPAQATPAGAQPATSPAATAMQNEQSQNQTQPHQAAAQAPAGVLVKPTDAIGTGSATPPATTTTPPMNIADLPEDVQQQIPNLTFSSHIYSDDAKYRMVNINGKLLHEGDMVADGIRLVRITEEGVVLSFEGYTFKVSVLHDWSFN